jgi:hypothetical protein
MNGLDDQIAKIVRPTDRVVVAYAQRPSRSGLNVHLFWRAGGCEFKLVIVRLERASGTLAAAGRHDVSWQNEAAARPLYGGRRKKFFRNLNRSPIARTTELFGTQNTPLAIRAKFHDNSGFMDLRSAYYY